MVPTFDIGSRRIDYSVQTGTSRRYTYFRFRPDLTLEVIIPRGSKVDVEREIRERTGWLRREFERQSKTKRILTSGSVMFDGKVLKVVQAQGPGDRLEVDMGRGEVRVGTTDMRQLRELVRRWFLKESSSFVVRKVPELARAVGSKPSRVDVREMGKWGYCTRTGRLSFSWQLIALPEKLREYVVYHELTHLLEFNHSAAFRRRLAKVCPDFRELERELDQIVPYDRLAPVLH